MGKNKYFEININGGKITKKHKHFEDNIASFSIFKSN